MTSNRPPSNSIKFLGFSSNYSYCYPFRQCKINLSKNCHFKSFQKFWWSRWKHRHMVCNVMYSMETLNMRVLNRRPLEVPPCYSLPPTHGSSFKSVWLSEFEHFKINTVDVPRKILVLVAFSFNFLPCKNSRQYLKNLWPERGRIFTKYKFGFVLLPFRCHIDTTRW